MHVRCCTTAVGTRSSSGNVMFTPTRRRGHEILDDPSAHPALAERSLRDVALANRLFGGRRAVVQAVSRVLRDQPAPAEMSLLDLGTGLGDIPHAAQRVARRRGLALRTMGLELTHHLARAARPSCDAVLAGNAMSLPFADRSIDIVTCSQVLHHFDGEDAEQLLRECTRVAKMAVVIGDLRRSWLAVAGLWVSSFALGFHPVSRHDGVVSILRGFTTNELARLVEKATHQHPVVRRAFGWRVTATWTVAISSP
jgi:ubiquinone/menaquinone biosynthesis C-methylase UbiE